MVNNIAEAKKFFDMACDFIKSHRRKSPYIKAVKHNDPKALEEHLNKVGYRYTNISDNDYETAFFIALSEMLVKMCVELKDSYYEELSDNAKNVIINKILYCVNILITNRCLKQLIIRKIIDKDDENEFFKLSNDILYKHDQVKEYVDRILDAFDECKQLAGEIMKNAIDQFDDDQTICPLNFYEKLKECKDKHIVICRPSRSWDLDNDFKILINNFINDAYKLNHGLVGLKQHVSKNFFYESDLNLMGHMLDDCIDKYYKIRDKCCSLDKIDPNGDKNDQ